MKGTNEPMHASTSTRTLAAILVASLVLSLVPVSPALAQPAPAAGAGSATPAADGLILFGAMIVTFLPVETIRGSST